ncbi:Uncharacterised protein [uncultured Ruminococcus sp.]|nr:Uncharacterised protein [uncultured Ruminococcus sp.]
MIRFICNYLRGCCCKHDFELIAHVKIADYFRGEKVICGERNTYRCKKCGFVQKVNF